MVLLTAWKGVHGAMGVKERAMESLSGESVARAGARKGERSERQRKRIGMSSKP